MLDEKNRFLFLETASWDNVLPLTSSCNLKCIFCSHRQNPPGIKVHYFPPLPFDFVEELISFLDGNRKIVLGESSTRLCEGEPFTHPHILDILKKIRETFPSAPLQITTNGTFLTENVVKELKKLGGEGKEKGPLLELVVSLNTFSPRFRSSMMGDRAPQRALKGVELLREYGLSFHGSVVAMPHLTGWEELEKTLTYLEEKGALTSRVFLPGYTRFTPEEEPFPSSLWRDTFRFLSGLKSRLNHPVLLEPPLKKNLLPIVEGVIKSSPAERAGVKRGDLIREVNGKKPFTGTDAFYLLQKKANPHVLIRREAAKECEKIGSSFFQPDRGLLVSTTLSKEEYTSSGVVLSGDLEGKTLLRVRAEIERKKAAFPLLLTSKLAAPLWVAAKKENLLPSRLQVSVVKNRFFGGSICCAGLLTVSDFKAHLENIFRKKAIPNLLLVPSAPFDRRGFDLKGEHFQEILASFPGLNISFL